MASAYRTRRAIPTERIEKQMKHVVGTLLLGTLALGLSLGCNDDGPTALDGRDDPIDGAFSVVLVSQLDTLDWPRDPATIEAARFQGDMLTLTIAYTGGCGAHEFSLVVSTSFMESHPVQTVGLLAHDANGDPCEAQLRGQLTADLSPLKDEWQTSYASDRGRIVIHLLSDSEPGACADAPWARPGGCSLSYAF